MACRLAFASLLLAAGACDASLGPGTGGGGTDATERRMDSGVSDTQPVDAAIDARPCTGGNAAAMAPDGSCLVHFTAMPITYAAAKLACMNMNAHLAYLKTAQLDTFAETFIGTLDTWIGGNDIATENAFVWDDTTPFAFTNWHTGEPNNGGASGIPENCVIIAGARTDKQWDDRPCDSSMNANSGKFAYLCQY